jgi:thiamine pyrophosphokinase
MRAILLGPVLSSLSQTKSLIQGLIINSKSDLLVGVDGGTGHWFKMGYRPSFSIGDWDSLKNKKSILSRVPHVTLSQNKDRSDLFFSVLAAMNAGASEIVCVGVTQGRADHQVAMLLDLCFFASGQAGKLTSLEVRGEDADYYFLSRKINSWKKTGLKGKKVSLFAMGSKVTGLTLKGFKFLLKNKDLLPSSQGLSNVVIGNSCEVRLRNGQLLMIIPHDG